MVCDDSEDELDDNDGDIDTDYQINELQLGGNYDDHGKANLKEWFAGIKRDPLKCAHKVIHLLRSLDQCREGFCQFIQDVNEQNWFSEKSPSGKRCLVQVPKLQLLRDVKTRWDSVYIMLQCLRILQLVSLSQCYSGD
jgi:hypothetical protein